MGELQMFQDKCEDTRNQLNTEIKEREESEAEVNNCTRKMKMMEEKIEKNDERFESISSKLQSASDHFAESDDRRQHVETQYQSTGDKIELLERQSELQRSLTPNVKRLFVNWFWVSTTRTEQRRGLPGVMLRLRCSNLSWEG